MPTMVMFPCGHPRNEVNSRLHRGKTRKTPAAVCKTCSREYSAKWRKENPARHRLLYKAMNTANRFKDTGWTETEYENAYKTQGGLCAICEQPPQGKRLNADHDHSKPLGEGQRALLCQKCNHLLGLAHDSVSRLIRAAEYLDNYGDVPCPVW